MIDIKQLNLQYLTNADGERTAVLLTIDQFNELLEDIEDLAAIAERHDEPTLAHDELVTMLQQNGLV
jgi:hypothetical protein